METRRLGRTDLQIAPLVFGGNVFGVKVDQAMTDRLLDAFVDAGFNAVDTADVYPAFIPGKPGGGSEEQIGRWFARGGGRRERLLVITKLGLLPQRAGLRRENILAAAEDSLARLRTDRIDVYMSHVDDPRVPVEETLRAYEDLLQAGKVRAIGASNFGLRRLAESAAASARLGIHRYECVEPRYNLVERGDFEGALRDWCLAGDVGVLCYFALACGFLGGRYRSTDARSGSWRDEFVAPYLNARGFGVLAAVDAVAARHGATTAQVALAWLLAQPGVTAPIASASSPEQLAELMGAAQLRLDAQDLAELAAASS